MIRRVLLTIVGAAAAGLVPWTAYLAGTLPDQHDTDQWRLAWVGFDTALIGCFAAAAWLAVRRRRAAVPLLAATAALLCCDAWFDVVLDWTSPDRWTSVILAVFVELPFAVLLLLRARTLLVGGMPSRALTVQDITIHTDPSYQRLTRTLSGLAPATADTVAAALARPVDEVTAALTWLARHGHVRQGRDGRWRAAPQDLRPPKLDEIDEADRPRVAAYFDAKYDRELRLMTWAARHRDEFGPWGQGSRAVAHLTEAELERLYSEYMELVIRYGLLRTVPEFGTREIAIRFYAFPYPDVPLNLTAEPGAVPAPSA